jgi:hypothetical protein
MMAAPLHFRHNMYTCHNTELLFHTAKRFRVNANQGEDDTL